MVPPGVLVREVRPEDRDRVRELFAAGQEEMIGPDTADPVIDTVRNYTREVLEGELSDPFQSFARPGRCLWVAEVDSHVVGTAAATADESEPGVCILGRVNVDAEYRRQGIATSLISTAEQWATAQGHGCMRLFTTSYQADALRLYRQLGYIEIGTAPYEAVTETIMEKPLT